MELSIIRLQEPARDVVGDRRRRVRHKLLVPAYVSFKGPTTGMALELSELVDLSEDGFAVQTAERLEVGQPVDFSLDLPETKFHLYSAGQVVWCDDASRAGIRFSGLSDNSKRQLKEWLFDNLLIASTNYAARAAGSVQRAQQNTAAPQPVVPSSMPGSVADLSGMLSAIEAVRREVRAAGDDFNGALHLITERALSLTGASGAALALLTDSRMVCRSSTGEPALLLGTPVDSKQGLSGECVRSGRTVMCEDTETDTRVDPEVCRSLGIGSILAAPILSDFRVVGLLEVFSSQSRAFTAIHETALDRLVELVSKEQPTALPPKDITANVTPPATASAIDSIRETAWEPAQESLKGVPVRLVHVVLVSVMVAALALASGYLAGLKLAPKIERLWPDSPTLATRRPTDSPGAGSNASGPITPTLRVANMRKRAEQGDPDAQWNLGASYRNGEGVKQDDVEAFRWYQRAADQGHVAAQSTLGASYWAGRGVPKDLTQAYFWSAVALHQGDRDSESRLRGLTLQMTRAQVAAAQQQADEWLRQHQVSR